MSRQGELALVLLCVLAAPSSGSESAGQVTAFAVPQPVEKILHNYCYDCHGEKKNKGKIRLDTLPTLEQKVRLELLSKLEEQVHLAEMPPEDEKQPNPTERKLLSEWVRNEIVRSNAPSIEDKLRYPDYGNVVDHDKLFSGTITEKAFTPARRWLVNPYIFEERVLEIFGLPEKARAGLLASQIPIQGVANPFLLPDHSGVRDYDIARLEGGHLLAMLGNAEYLSKKQLQPIRVKKEGLKPDDPELKLDKFQPKTPFPAFEAIALSDAVPTDGQIDAAIQTQFASVLQRPASEQELQKYRTLTRSTIAIGGNYEGLRQMLAAVLLESEFLYRLEFGAGTTDQYGRRMLSPREAGYAISYALGDRRPDPTLAKAAQDGKLNTKEDYRREVLRLLADQNYYRGLIDRTVNDRATTSHPRIIRFFRDFFGYPNAVKVFKDKPRSGGYYDNPDRGSAGTPGHLVREADMLVDWHVQKDQQVFETLLTTDQFFVYHPIDNEAGQKIIADWKDFYTTLKDTDWRNNPQKVAEDHRELLAKNRIDPDPKKQGHANSFLRVMEHFSYTFGKGLTPFPRFPWEHGYKFNYSQSYSLPSTPGVGGRYGGDDQLDYPVVQPFKLARRMGVLTHPAWLIAHSANSHTDPIKRGRWVQEKLLAGRVPDVPITVDAVVPDSPHLTFRERVEKATEQSTCWNCHQKMNPLGYPFERFDDFGRYRTEESLEHPDNLIAKSKDKYGADLYKTKPLNTTGELRGTRDPGLDGEVKDPFEMIDRLAKSTRVRQSFIRHAFRFFLGRNEMLSDAQTLIDADKAYVSSGGSFKAVIVSLLTSDSFMYRK